MRDEWADTTSVSPSEATGLRYGASLDIRFGETVREFVQFVTELGLTHVELRWGYVDVNGVPDPDTLRSLSTEYDVTFTVHAPHIDCAVGNLNESLRLAAVAEVKSALDFADASGAVGVVVHGGTTRTRYPKHVRARSREQAVRSIRECAAYADTVEVPLCLENGRDTPTKRRHTATPDRIDRFLEDVGAETAALRLTLDIGHANATGLEYRTFVDRFTDRIHVVHLHDNDGDGDDHEPLPGFRGIAEETGANYGVLEMKSRTDIERCVGPQG